MMDTKPIYYVAQRPRGHGVPDISQALTHHRTLEAANRAAQRINRTGSDVQVYSTDPIKQYLSEIGRKGGLKGGKSRSCAKLAAIRRNAKKGGRPKGSKNKPKA